MLIKKHVHTTARLINDIRMLHARDHSPTHIGNSHAGCSDMTGALPVPAPSPPLRQPNSPGRHNGPATIHIEIEGSLFLRFPKGKWETMGKKTCGERIGLVDEGGSFSRTFRTCEPEAYEGHCPHLPQKFRFAISKSAAPFCH